MFVLRRADRNGAYAVKHLIGAQVQTIFYLSENPSSFLRQHLRLTLHKKGRKSKNNKKKIGCKSGPLAFIWEKIYEKSNTIN